MPYWASANHFFAAVSRGSSSCPKPGKAPSAANDTPPRMNSFLVQDAFPVVIVFLLL